MSKGGCDDAKNGSRRFAPPMLALLLAAVLAVGSSGCATTRPGPLTAVAPVGGPSRAGNAYLLRGWIGVFSTGINSLTEQLDAQGVRAHVYQDDQWSKLADAIIAAYGPVPPGEREPVVLVGHSYGADDAIRIARKLEPAGIAVDLLVTLDPVTPPALPANVRRCVNLYQSNGAMDALPFLRGVPMVAAPDAPPSALQNVDIRKDRPDLLAGDAADLDHFNIEKKATIHQEVLARVLEACPPRAAWASRRGPARDELTFASDSGR